MHIKKGYIFAADFETLNNNLLKITTMAKKTTNVANENVANVNANVNEVKNNAKEESKKVSAKVAVKATNTISRFIKSERIGVNATIRILLDAANDGNEDAINTLCALCDVPTDMAFTITVDDVRKAVNDWYPYVMEINARRINVRAKSVYYSTASASDEDIIEARKRVAKGFIAIEVTDYLTALTSATKARAKGTKQIVVDNSVVYDDNKFANVTNVKVDAIRDAHERKTFLWSAVNIWRKNSLLGYYI